MGRPVQRAPWRGDELLCAWLLQGLVGWRAAAPQRLPAGPVLCCPWKKCGKTFFCFCVKEETREKSCKQLQMPLPGATVCWSPPWSPKFFGTISVAIVLFCFLNISCPCYRDLGVQCTVKGCLRVRRLPRVAAWHLVTQWNSFFNEMFCAALGAVLERGWAGMQGCLGTSKVVIGWSCAQGRGERAGAAPSPARQQREAAPGLSSPQFPCTDLSASRSRRNKPFLLFPLGGGAPPRRVGGPSSACGDPQDEVFFPDLVSHDDIHGQRWAGVSDQAGKLVAPGKNRLFGASRGEL